MNQTEHCNLLFLLSPWYPNLVISFDYCWFLAANLLIFYPSLENSITDIAIRPWSFPCLFSFCTKKNVMLSRIIKLIVHLKLFLIKYFYNTWHNMTVQCAISKGGKLPKYFFFLILCQLTWRSMGLCMVVSKVLVSFPLYLWHRSIELVSQSVQ